MDPLAQKMGGFDSGLRIGAEVLVFKMAQNHGPDPVRTPEVRGSASLSTEAARRTGLPRLGKSQAFKRKTRNYGSWQES